MSNEIFSRDQELSLDADLYECGVREIKEYAIFMMNPDGRIISWNKGVKHIFGYSESEFIGQPSALVFTPEERERDEPGKEIAEAARTGEAGDDRWHLRKDGSRFWCNGMLTAMRDETGEPYGFVKVMRDNTEEKLADEALAQSEAALKALAETLEERVNARTQEVRELASQLTLAEKRERERIAQILHNDIQQLLFAVLYKVKELGKGGMIDAPEVKELQDTEEMLSHAIQTARTLAVELSPPVLKDEGLETILRWLAAHVEEFYGLEIELDVVINGALMLTQEHRVLLFQGVQELLLNVAKHAAVNRAGLEAFDDNGSVVIIIKDSGIGFDPDVLLQEQKPSFGLAMLRERMALLGGALKISARPGEGTQVTLRLPATETSAEY